MCSRRLILSFLLLSAVGAAAGESIQIIRPPQLPQPGQEATFGVRGIDEAKTKDGKAQNVPFVVYLPTNWTRTKKWPVVMEWHGQGGQASVTVSRQATGGKDFICVGLTYINAQEKTEDKYVKAVYDVVVNNLGGDARAVFPGGFSFGGLALERFILRPATVGRYRAAWMFGAGLVGSDFKPAELKWLSALPIFEAVGETDFNRQAAEQALPQFKAVVPNLELHVQPGVGHTVDLKNFGPKLLEFFKRNLPGAEEQAAKKDAKKESAAGEKPAVKEK